jgi:hypothetical protein
MGEKSLKLVEIGVKADRKARVDMLRTLANSIENGGYVDHLIVLAADKRNNDYQVQSIRDSNTRRSDAAFVCNLAAYQYMGQICGSIDIVDD